MSETKTGLEVTILKHDQTGTQGKVFYNALLGTLGTAGCGVGTAATTGISKVYVGSGVAICSGVVRYITGGTSTVGSSAAEYTCYNVEVGSDGTVDITTGTAAASVAAAIAARTATQSGHVQLGYVTTGTSGTVKSGSIVDERTCSVGTALSYMTGADYEWSDSPIHVYDGSAYAHSKKQRGKGKVTLKQNFVVSTDDPWPSTGGDYMSVPRIALEYNIDDIGGTVGNVTLLTDCVKESAAVSMPEEEMDTSEYSAFYGSMMEW